MKHLAHVARQVGIKELVAEVLSDNFPMLKVFKKSGLPLSAKQKDGVVHIVLKLL
jgi:RimJ/RimL family protein N-acetyltransferase